jgi:transposase
MKILVAVEPADIRRGIDGLARICQESLRHDVLSGAAFVFRNRKATALKLLMYDGRGFCVTQGPSLFMDPEWEIYEGSH